VPRRRRRYRDRYDEYIDQILVEELTWKDGLLILGTNLLGGLAAAIPLGPIWTAIGAPIALAGGHFAPGRYLKIGLMGFGGGLAAGGLASTFRSVIGVPIERALAKRGWRSPEGHLLLALEAARFPEEERKKLTEEQFLDKLCELTGLPKIEKEEKKELTKTVERTYIPETGYAPAPTPRAPAPPAVTYAGL